MLDDSGPSSQSSQTNLNHPIWGTPNALDPGAPALLNMARTDPVWRWQAWKRRNPDWKDPLVCWFRSRKWKVGNWSIKIVEYIPKHSFWLVWYTTCHPLPVPEHPKALFNGSDPIVTNQPSGQRLPWRSTHISKPVVPHKAVAEVSE